MSYDPAPSPAVDSNRRIFGYQLEHGSVPTIRKIKGRSSVTLFKRHTYTFQVFADTEVVALPLAKVSETLMEIAD